LGIAVALLDELFVVRHRRAQELLRNSLSCFLQSSHPGHVDEEVLDGLESPSQVLVGAFLLLARRVPPAGSLLLLIRGAFLGAEGVFLAVRSR